MQLPRDLLSGLYRKPDIYLCETDKTRICKLETTNTKGSFKFNSMSELTFDVARVYNNIVTGLTSVNPYYDKIEALRLIELDNFGFFELQGPELVSDGIKEQKSCTAYSLEYTLSQKFLENFYVNTGGVDSLEVLNASSLDNIVPIVLYDPSNKKLSLLHLILEKVYGWKIGHVDRQLQTLSRQFEIDRESVYDFIINEICDKFNCYVVFDTFNNTINVYAESPTAKFIGDGHTNTFKIGSEYADEPLFSSVETVSVDGYKTTRWSYVIEDNIGILYLEDTPKAGAMVEAVGVDSTWETNVFVTFNNLSQEIKVNYDADNIKTVLSVTYGDDYDIREVNLGLPYLTDLSYYYNVDWMGQDLYDAYTAYLKKSNDFQLDYTNNSKEILKINDKIYYEENRLSLNYSKVVDIDKTTVGTYYIKTENSDGSFYYTEVSLPSEYKVGTEYYSNASVNLNETKVKNLYTALQNYFYTYYNDDSEKLANAVNELSGLSDSFNFMKAYTISYLINSLQNSSSDSDKETAIYNFFNEMFIEVGRTPLKTLYLAPYKSVQEINIKAGWSQKSNTNYGRYYPVVLLINAIERAIALRDTVINTYIEQRKVFENNNANISNQLLMTNNFTEGQLIRLNAFLREDELHLDDIVQTSLDNLSSSFKIKQDAMETGRIELKKLSTPQLQFSMTMANIYALPEFEPIIDQFQLGRMIKVGIRSDYIKQSRLLQADINFDDFSDFSCEFGELTNLRTQSDIHADLLSKAISAGKSVASNSGYWTQGADKATSTDLKIQQGLLDATTQIKAIDGEQGIVIDKYGIRCQKKDPDTGAIDPHQLWITNNMLLYSDDAFQTSRSAFGQITVDGSEYYGLIAEMVLSGYIEGSHIYGGTIKIGEQPDGSYAFEVDQDGKVTMKSSNIGGYVTTDDLEEFEEEISGALQDQLDGSITTWFYDIPPELDSEPTVLWDTEALKNAHIGDIYYDTKTGYCYCWTLKDEEYSWEQTLDNGLADAMEAASNAQDTADGKRRVFTNTPTTPYDIGDLWAQGSSGDLMRCKTAKSADKTFDEKDWELASKYTDDTKANEAHGLASEISKTIDTITLKVVNNDNGEMSGIQLGINDEGKGYVDMTGLVTFRGLGDVDDVTTINGANITTGTIKIGEYVEDGETKYHFEVDEQGNVTMSSSSNSINGYLTTEDLEEFEKIVSGIHDQVDGYITTWFESGEPTTDNAPAVNWNTVDLKKAHIGDLYYDSETGYCYRWQVANNTYSWGKITDQDISNALSSAQEAKDTADGKRRVFTSTPKPPYDVGDLWAAGSSGDLKRCKKAKTSTQSYSSFDWELATKYTDDTFASEIKKTVDSLELSVTNTEDGSSSFIQLTGEGITTQSHEIKIKGFVTFEDLSGTSTTTINGAKIESGEISAVDITGCNITSGDIDENSDYSVTMNNGKLLFYNANSVLSAELYAKKYTRNNATCQNFFIDGAGDVSISSGDDIIISSIGPTYINSDIKYNDSNTYGIEIGSYYSYKETEGVGIKIGGYRLDVYTMQDIKMEANNSIKLQANAVERYNYDTGTTEKTSGDIHIHSSDGILIDSYYDIDLESVGDICICSYTNSTCKEEGEYVGRIGVFDNGNVGLQSCIIKSNGNNEIISRITLRNGTTGDPAGIYLEGDVYINGKLVYQAES